MLLQFKGSSMLTICKDPSHSGFVYSCLGILFHPYTVNILNVSYYLTIKRDLVQVGLRSKTKFFTQSHHSIALKKHYSVQCPMRGEWKDKYLDYMELTDANYHPR